MNRLAAICLLLILPVPVLAEIRWPVDGAQASDLPGNVYSTTVQADGSGGAFVCFVWAPAGLSDAYILAQHLDAQGYRTWTPSGVTVSAGPETRWDPILALGPDGGVWVGYKYATGITFHDLYVDYLAPDGTQPWPAPVFVADTPDAQQNDLEIKADGQGHVLLSWYDNSLDWTGDMRVQKIDRDGNKLWNGGASVRVAENTMLRTESKLAPTGDGGGVVVWVDDRTDPEGDIYAQCFDADGNALWAAGGRVVCGAPGAQDEPRVVLSSTGVCWVVWRDFRSGARYEAYLQALSGAGLPLGPAGGFSVGSATGSQLEIQLCAGSAGDVFLAWVDTRAQTHSDIYGQRILDDRSPAWGAGGRALAAYNNDQTEPVLCGDGSGGVICAWKDARLGGSFQIYAQHFDPSGTADWGSGGVRICGHSGETNAINISENGRGGAVIAWEDARTGNGNAFAQEIDKLMPQVLQVTPEASLNTGTADLDVQGAHLSGVVQARLARSGSADVIGACVPAMDTQMGIAFSLTGVARGDWDLVLTDDVGQVSRRSGAFKVLAPGVYGLGVQGVIGATFVPDQTHGWVLDLVPAMDLGDTLTALRLVNRGTAESGRDILGVGLWKLAGGAVFNPGTAQPLGTLSAEGGAWTWPAGPGVPLAPGERLAVTVDVAHEPLDLTTCRFAVEAGGAGFAIGGPQGAADVENPYAQNIMRIAQGLFAQYTPLAPVNAIPGQTAVPLLTLTLNNRSQSIQTVERVRLTAAEGSGAGVDPAGVLRRVRVRGPFVNGLWEPAAAGGTDRIDLSLSPPMTIGPGEAPSLSFDADLAEHPVQDRFQVRVPGNDLLNDGVLIVQNEVSVQYPLSAGIIHVREPVFARSLHAYPNPCQTSREFARLVYFLPETADVWLRVLTPAGERVRTLIDGERQSQGLHDDVMWNGLNDRGAAVVSGVYRVVLRIRSADGREQIERAKLAVTR